MKSVFLIRLSRDLKLGVKNLLLHKLRSVLTMLGLVFGVGSVIAMLAIGEGASQETINQIRKLGSQNILLEAQKPTDENASGRNLNLSVYGLLYQDVLRLQASFPTIQRVIPAKAIQKPGRYAKRTLDLRIIGTTEQWFDVVPRELIAGRRLSKEDLDKHANVAVLTEYGARRLLGKSYAIGGSMTVDGKAFEIIGIIKNENAGEGQSQTLDRQTDAYIPLSTVRERFGDLTFNHTNGSVTRELVELHEVVIRVDREENVEATAQAVTRMLETFHKRKDYQVNVPLALLRQTEATKRTFSIVLGAIAGISLLVGGIGIMNIMLASVTERTREIGIRRAIGARRSQIVMQFLIESLVLSSLGGLIGIGLGLLIPFAVTTFASMPTIVTWSSLVLSLGISVAVGVIFGIYPAIRAARLDPIVALRHD